MPLQVLQFRPGVSRESTNLANEGGWYDCDKIRFRSGLPEKIGGWSNATSATFLGTCRKLYEWESLSNFYLLGLGTDLKYYATVGVGGQFYDITPYRRIVTLSSPFATVYTTLSANITATATTIPVTSLTTFAIQSYYVIQIGSEKILVSGFNTTTTSLSVVQRGYNGTTAVSHTSGTAVSSSYLIVSDTSNGAYVNDFVIFANVSPFGPYTALGLNQQFQIIALGTNKYIIDSGVQSTSATTGGGAAVTASYQLNTGASIYQYASGWGESPWGSVGATTGSTTLSAVLNNTATTINVASTSSFAAAGYIQIDAEIIQYTGTTLTSFTGCTRSTVNATYHGNGAGVLGVQASYLTSTWGYSTSSANTAQLRIWSSDNFGANLVYNYRQGPILYWDTSAGVSSSGTVVTRGVYLAGGGTGTTPLTTDTYAPTIANWVFVTDQRYIVALGVGAPAITVGGTPGAQDPMAISWCVQGDPTVWTPTATNTAGTYRLGYGSKIVTAEKTRQEMLIFTDSALVSMQYTGDPYVYGFYTISTDTTIVGPNAVTTTNGITYWMGSGKFYAYSGRVDTLPCALRQYVFDDINLDQGDQIYAGTNDRYNEIWWFYCSKGSDVIDKYVIYNYLEKLWYYGTMNRTAWFDSHIQGYPWAVTSPSLSAGNIVVGQIYIIDTLGTTDFTQIGSPNNSIGTRFIATASGTGTGTVISTTGLLLQHENSLNDGTVNPPAAINAYIESADFDIGDADKFSFVKRVIPDVDFIGSTSSAPSVTMTLAARDFPGQGLDKQTQPAAIAGAPLTVSSSVSQVYNYTNQVYIRLRGRQVAFRIESDQTDMKWQLGVPKIEIQQDGRRS